jgi:hypothetical protein
MVSAPNEITLRAEEAYELGAALLVLIARADEKPPPEPGELLASLCGRALWARYLSVPDDLAPITVKPQYVFRETRTIDRDTAYVGKKIKERLVAGRMAMAFLKKAALGDEFKLPKAIKRLSLNQIAEFVLDDAEQADHNNVERRVWAPSRPVIHLAAAMVSLAQYLRNEGISVGIETVLLVPELATAIIHLAQAYEEIIAKSPEFPVKAENLIRVRIG